jgi:hypothetical protein
MATAARITANQLNAQNSTGPVTSDGKTKSSANSLRHGLTAKQMVLSTEDPDAFNALRERLLAEHDPQGALETALVEQIAGNLWRLQRAQRFERNLVESLYIQSDPGAIPAVERVLRYLTAIERAFHRSIRELANLQTARRKDLAAEEQTQAARSSAASDQLLEELLAPLPLGFVSQNATTPTKCMKSNDPSAVSGNGPAAPPVSQSVRTRAA